MRAEPLRSAWPDERKPAGAGAFSIPCAHAILADLFAPDPWIYWTDLLVTTAIAYSAAAVYLFSPNGWLVQAPAFAVAGAALFRAGTFVHELAHLGSYRWRGFRASWNVLVGLPTLMPSWFYENHVDHHGWRTYGTPEDGEYLPLAISPVSQLLLYCAQVPLIPLVAVLRFLVLGPVALVHGGVRRFVEEQASSLVSNPHYRRPARTERRPAIRRTLELLLGVGLAGAGAALVLGLLPWSVLPKLYLLAVYGLSLNWLRNAAAHRYGNAGASMTPLDQLRDSITITGRPVWTEILFPLGLRYHALHHLFPNLPYHSLRRGHERLMAVLPAGSPYHATVCPGVWAVLRKLWRSARGSSRPGAISLWRRSDWTTPL